SYLQESGTEVSSLEHTAYVQNANGEVHTLEPSQRLRVSADRSFGAFGTFSLDEVRGRHAFRGPRWVRPAGFRRMPPRLVRGPGQGQVPHPWVRQWHPGQLPGQMPQWHPYRQGAPPQRAPQQLQRRRAPLAPRAPEPKRKPEVQRAPVMQ